MMDIMGKQKYSPEQLDIAADRLSFILKKIIFGKPVSIPGLPYPLAVSEEADIGFFYGNPGREFIVEKLEMGFLLRKFMSFSEKDWQTVLELNDLHSKF